MFNISAKILNANAFHNKSIIIIFIYREFSKRIEINTCKNLLLINVNKKQSNQYFIFLENLKSTDSHLKFLIEINVNKKLGKKRKIK